MGKLTTQLDSMSNYDNQGGLSIDNPVNFEQIIQKLSDVVSKEAPHRKSNLIDKNVIAIIQGLTLNHMMEIAFGREFRIELIDSLILNKLEFTMSLHKDGINDVIRAIGQIQPNVIGAMPPTLIEKVTGLESKK